MSANKIAKAQSSKSSVIEAPQSAAETTSVSTGYPGEGLVPVDSYSPAYCAIYGMQSGFSNHFASLLCPGAKSSNRAACAHRAWTERPGLFTQAQSVELCQTAESDAPVSCAFVQVDAGFSTNDAVTTCAGAKYSYENQ